MSEGEFMGRLQGCVFRLRLFQDRDRWVCIFPQPDEVLIKRSSVVLFAFQCSGTRKPEVSKSCDRFVDGHSGVIENPLEFGESRPAVVDGQVRFSTHKSGIHVERDDLCRLAQFVPPRVLQQFNGVIGVLGIQRDLGANDRQIVELHESVLGILLGDAIRQSLRSHTITSKCIRHRCGSLRILTTGGDRNGRECVLRFLGVAVQGLMDGAIGAVSGGRFFQVSRDCRVAGAL
jgi:hypothetical protein